MSEAFDPLSVAQDLSEIDVSDPMIFKNDAFRPIFARLRQEAPVHYCKESPFGPILVDYSFPRHYGGG